MKILAIAPHPDDETLGCGGTLLKHKNNGDEINWLIITDINSKKVGQKIELRSVRTRLNKYQIFTIFQTTKIFHTHQQKWI